MSEQDYWHKIGGQRWLAERLGAERKKVAALERIADALELHANLLLPDTGDKNDESQLERDALREIAEHDYLDADECRRIAREALEEELRTRPETKHTEETQEGR